jgi:hypothetical protein
VEKMGDLVMGERWNTGDSLDMALGVRRAVESLLRKKDPPSECREFLDGGITFLDEARGGEALISGAEEADSFNGTFLPLCLATEVRIRFIGDASNGGEGTKIGELLNQYKETLKQIKEKGAKSNINPVKLKEIGSFFEALSRLLLQQADPMMKDFSQTYSYSQPYV